MVKITFTLATAVLAGSTLAAPNAAPIADAAPNAVANAVADPPAPGASVGSNKPPPQCAGNGNLLSNWWAVYVNDNTMGNGYAGSLLDSLRSKGGCAAVSNWQAIPDGHGGVAATFNTPKFCQGSDVADAIHSASKEWIYCSGDTLDSLFDSAGKIIDKYTDNLKDVSGILSAFE